MCSADDESGDGQITKTQDDVDSEVTFQDDADLEMDTTTAIEEEDWIDYIKRSIVDAMDTMERAKIRCCNRTHKKMKWKLTQRIAISPSERWLKKAAEWNAELSSRYKTTERLEDREKYGKMISTNSSNKNLKKMKMKTQSRAVIKPTKLGSTSQGPQKMGSTRRNLHFDRVKMTT